MCALTALGLGLFTTLPTHRTWGLLAAAGYGCAALAAALRARGRDTARAPTASSQLPLILALMGAVALPLLLLVLAGSAQLEVRVVERSGDLLLHSGSPYTAAPTTVGDYNPYLPGMAAFGLPHALFGDGPLTDARGWMAGTFFVSMSGAVATMLVRPRRAGTHHRPGLRTMPHGYSRPVVRWLAACPLVALPLAVGGIDLPVIGLMCWGLATAGRGKPGWAGLLLGLGAALKWTAWPAVPVALALIAARHGRRQVITCGAITTLTTATAVLPFALTTPGAFAENVLAFPMGLGMTASPAESPLPGRLLAAYVPDGTLLAMVLLAVAAFGMAASLLIRPPRTVPAAADRLVLGLALAMALMPATRFGYLAYPLVLWVWPRLTSAALARRTANRRFVLAPSPADTAVRTGPGESRLCGSLHTTDGSDRKRAKPEIREEAAR
ncbi:glycosyltransferase 87 family protein [Streptomyces sp. MspMP-M5]|uniref:glycosyltransferase 87 family protein n=1 Tax=unclassified Streptomyces TaxID=2593676 RepID=UPI0003825C6D|nr:glycosyltransferase 87 family protein [Streptomyces sp. MspMP-M5]